MTLPLAEIGADPFTEALGLPHVQNVPAVSLHEVDTRGIREGCQSLGVEHECQYSGRQQFWEGEAILRQQSIRWPVYRVITGVRAGIPR